MAVTFGNACYFTITKAAYLYSPTNETIEIFIKIDDFSLKY